MPENNQQADLIGTVAKAICVAQEPHYSCPCRAPGVLSCEDKRDAAVAATSAIEKFMSQWTQ